MVYKPPPERDVLAAYEKGGADEAVISLEVMPENNSLVELELVAKTLL